MTSTGSAAKWRHSSREVIGQWGVVETMLSTDLRSQAHVELIFATRPGSTVCTTYILYFAPRESEIGAKSTCFLPDVSYIGPSRRPRLCFCSARQDRGLHRFLAVSNVVGVESKEYQVRYNITFIVGDSPPDSTARGWESFVTHRRPGASSFTVVASHDQVIFAVCYTCIT